VAQSAQPAQAHQGRQAADGPAAAHLVTGIVRDLNGHALGGVCVLATGADGVPRMARTSASGRYVMSLPNAGAYSVRYRYCQPGKAAVPASAVARRIEVGASPVTALPVTTLRLASQTGDRTALAAEGIAVPREGRIIRLHTGAEPVARQHEASGTQTTGGMTGLVTGPAGRPIGGACVWIVHNDPAAGSEEALGISTTRNGTYSFSRGELNPGRYQVLFTSNCDGFTDPFVPLAPGPWAPEWYKDKFAQSRANLVQLRAGKVTRGINAVMRHAARIGGVVTGSDGRRVKNACVVAVADRVLEVGQGVTDSGGATGSLAWIPAATGWWQTPPA
jgi:hypothetical protein